MIPCDSSTWNDVVKICGECTAVVETEKVEPRPKSCASYCQMNGLRCKAAWDDVTNNECSMDQKGANPAWTCDYEWEDTSDAVCECEVNPNPDTDVYQPGPPANYEAHTGGSSGDSDDGDGSNAGSIGTVFAIFAAGATLLF